MASTRGSRDWVDNHSLSIGNSRPNISQGAQLDTMLKWDTDQAAAPTNHRRMGICCWFLAVPLESKKSMDRHTRQQWEHIWRPSSEQELRGGKPFALGTCRNLERKKFPVRSEGK